MSAQPETLQNLEARYTAALAPKVGEGEAIAIFQLAAGTVLRWSNTQLRMNAGAAIGQDDAQRLIDVLEQVAQGIPVQYALGEAEFHGLKLNVSPAVLIPRPETEELAQLIATDPWLKTQSNPTLWDIGTGSGCIALGLASKLPQATVHASDVSPEALAVATDNAQQNQLEVAFAEHNILKGPCNPFNQPLDLIVSNPPYVRDAEKSTMEPHVVNHEPHLALFVRDEDPLLFYRAILNCSEKALKPGGKLWFEINEALAAELTQLINCYTFDHPAVLLDMQGKQRFVTAQKLR